MCARLSQILPPEAMRRLFHLDLWKNLPPRYNVAPSQEVWIIRRREDGREALTMRWGLVPGWAKDTKIASKTINARSETVAEKPSFRSAFAKRRCIVPADGFYEWDKATSPRQPYRFVRQDGDPMALAGLWEDNEALGLTTFTIVTTRANRHLEDIGHDRSPVILEPAQVDAWLDPASSRETLEQLMLPFPDDAMNAYAVSTIVNNVRNDVPECIEPLEGPAQGLLL